MSGVVPFYEKRRKNIARVWFVRFEGLAVDILLRTSHIARYIRYNLQLKQRVFSVQLKPHITIIFETKNDHLAPEADSVAAGQAVRGPFAEYQIEERITLLIWVVRQMTISVTSNPAVLVICNRRGKNMCRNMPGRKHWTSSRYEATD